MGIFDILNNLDDIKEKVEGVAESLGLDGIAEKLDGFDLSSLSENAQDLVDKLGGEDAIKEKFEELGGMDGIKEKMEQMGGAGKVTDMLGSLLGGNKSEEA